MEKPLWLQFEINSTNYLNEKFSSICTFIHKGESNSKVSDIEVIKNNNSLFFIETKMCPAQSGQFVLKPNINDKKFEYSDKNITAINDFSKEIINYMNNNYETFINSGTKGTQITFKDDKKCFSNWIKGMYKDKNAKFLITNDYKILDINNLENDFNITATFRIKRSGTRNPSKKHYEDIKKYLETSYNNCEIYKEKSKLFVRSASIKDKDKFYVKGEEYLFSKRDENYFEIRKRGKTLNSNVIFSLNLKEQAKLINTEEFKKILYSY